MPADHDYRTGRLHQKYIIEKADGSPVDPEARYFVLRYDADPHARMALLHYADCVQDENFDFAVDIRRMLLETAASPNLPGAQSPERAS